jgi:hypothetical protein
VSDIESGKTESGAAPALGYALAVAWVLLPAVQYMGTYLRTGQQLNGEAHDELARLDLTRYYFLLLGLTIAFMLLRAVLNRITGRQGRPGAAGVPEENGA